MERAKAKAQLAHDADSLESSGAGAIEFLPLLQQAEGSELLRSQKAEKRQKQTQEEVAV